MKEELICVTRYAPKYPRCSGRQVNEARQFENDYEDTGSIARSIAGLTLGEMVISNSLWQDER
jgi:hypothetical protein